ncbi:Importin subunit alpha-8 [Heterocephalus glaber]|uniref:Importin subunit alpha-8 n=1 Tax=Heterocephalus glaber TaxID=10181 RepID=G5AX87_HETGA|nr:Importin subunit alpha-8 [Heterocephalus glaber]
MPTLDVPEERLKKFKYRGKDASARRQQRVALSLELRKAKKDEQALKRRSITCVSLDLASKGVGQHLVCSGFRVFEIQFADSNVSLTLDEIIKGVNSSDLAVCFQATQAIRKMLSRERNPPLKVIVESRVIPRIVEFLKSSHHPCLQFEAAWALTNIASGTSAETQAVVKGGAIPPLAELLSSPNMTVCEQAVWALGNIAGDGPEFRDVVISSNVIPRLTALVSSTTSITCLRNVTWTLSNLCRSKDPYPCKEAVRQILPVLSHLLQHQDSEILSDTCWALSYLTDACSERIALVLDTGVLPRLVELLTSVELSVLITCLRNVTWTLSNLCRSKDPYPCKEAVRQILPVLSHLLQHQDSEILSDTCWALSYLTDACSERIALVLDTGVLPRLVELLTSVELSVLTPSLRTVGNIVTGTDHQTQMAIDAGMLKVLPQLLQHPKSSIQKEATWALSNVAAGPQQHIQELITHNLLLPLVALLRNGEYKVQKEAVWTVANFATGASSDQLFQLVHFGVLGPLLNLLTVPDVKIILIILSIISYVLQASQKLSDKKSLCLLLEELGGMDRIEALQLHENCQISWAALKIIENHFGEVSDLPLKRSGHTS